MRRWFIALLTLLVAAQLSWAGAALCCVDELTQQQGQPVAVGAAADQAHADKAGEAHPVCETGHCHCHHAASATPSAQGHALLVAQALAPAPASAAPPTSHIPAGLERPNWLRA